MMLVPFHTESTLQRASVPRYHTSVKHRCPPSDVEHARRSVLVSRCGRHRSSLERGDLHVTSANCWGRMP